MRHSYWMYLITKELGPEVAKEFGDLHENLSIKKTKEGFTNNNQTKRGKMDLNNNNWGINFALKGVTLDYQKNYQYYFDTAVLNKNEIIIRDQRFMPNIVQKRKNQAKAIKKALAYGERE